MTRAPHAPYDTAELKLERAHAEIGELRAEIERLQALIYRNCNSITANEEDAKIIQEIAAALDPKP